MTRIKEVHSEGMIAHLWANKVQARARKAGTNNFYFEGDTIYSYGNHFPIAKHVTNKRGENAVLFTTRGYSVTTSGHISTVRQASRHLNIIECRNVNPYGKAEHAENWKAFLGQITNLKKLADKARARKDSYLAEAQGIVDNANKYSKFFGLRLKLESIEYAQVEVEKQTKKEQRATIKNAKERIKKTKENLALWLAGDNIPVNYLHYIRNADNIQLRIKGDMIETTQGAEFPVEHGIKAFKFILACKTKAIDWHKNGHTIHLGHFQLDSIDKDGNVKAGCHTIQWNEIERIAKLLGLLGKEGE